MFYRLINLLNFLFFLGGEELMKGAGKDATKMFDEIHAWVNYEQLLAKCYIGPLVNTATIELDLGEKSTAVKKLTITSNNGGFKTPAFLQSPMKQSAKIVSPTTSTAPVEIIPRFDWIQKTANLMLIFYTKALCNPGFSVELIGDSEAVIRIYIERTVHICSFKFAHEVGWPCTAKLSNETGKSFQFFKSIENITVCLYFFFNNFQEKLK